MVPPDEVAPARTGGRPGMARSVQITIGAIRAHARSTRATRRFCNRLYYVENRRVIRATNAIESLNAATGAQCGPAGISPPSQLR